MLLSYFNRISVFVWTGENRIRLRHMRTRISSRTEGKNLRFQKYLDACGQGLTNHTKRTDRDREAKRVRST